MSHRNINQRILAEQAAQREMLAALMRDRQETKAELKETNAKIDAGMKEIGAKIDSELKEVNARIQALDMNVTVLNERMNAVTDKLDGIGKTLEEIKAKPAENLNSIKITAVSTAFASLISSIVVLITTKLTNMFLK